MSYGTLLRNLVPDVSCIPAYVGVLSYFRVRIAEDMHTRMFRHKEAAWSGAHLPTSFRPRSTANGLVPEPSLVSYVAIFRFVPRARLPLEFVFSPSITISL
jgi:hypothetical protein